MNIYKHRIKENLISTGNFIPKKCHLFRKDKNTGSCAMWVDATHRIRQFIRLNKREFMRQTMLNKETMGFEDKRHRKYVHVVPYQQWFSSTDHHVPYNGSSFFFFFAFFFLFNNLLYFLTFLLYHNKNV